MVNVSNYKTACRTQEGKIKIITVRLLKTLFLQSINIRCKSVQLGFSLQPD
jgi:hypothetical protein